MDYTLVSQYPLSSNQNEGVDFLLHKGNSILGLKTGEGKTYAILTAAYHLMAKHPKLITVVVCPNQATGSFIKEMSQKLRQPLSIKTTDIDQRPKNSRVFLFNYSRLEPLKSLLPVCRSKGIQVLGIFDEVHKVGSQDSNTAKTLRQLRPYFSMVWGCSATLFLNNIENLFYVVDFVKPKYFGTIQDFRANYIIYKQRQIHIKGVKRTINEIVGYKNLETLNHLVSTICLIRGKTYSIDFRFYQTNMGSQELEDYREAAKGLIDEKYSVDNEKSFGARLHDLQRVADGSYYNNLTYTPSKIKLLVNLVQRIMERDESVLIYTEYEDSYTFIKKYLEKFKGELRYHRLYMINGKVAPEKRRQIEKSLSSRDVVIITKAGVASLNLQAANHIVFYNIPFSIGDIIQSIGRITRMDSIFSKQFIHVIEVNNSIDTYKRLLFQEHKALFEKVFGDTTDLPNMSHLEQEIIVKMKTYLKNKLLWKRF